MNNKITVTNDDQCSASLENQDCGVCSEEPSKSAVQVGKGYNWSLSVKQLLEKRGSPKTTFFMLGNPVTLLASH